MGTFRPCYSQERNDRDSFFQVLPEDAGLDVDRFLRDKDLEVCDVLAKSDLYEREGKNQHGFCLAVGREYPYDVRVLVNVRPDAYWMDTMLHEFGHAVYDKHINPKLPYFLRTVAHTCATEAIALMMGSLAEEPSWLEKVARRRAEGLVFTRWALVVYNFEKELYANPERQDLNSLWWDLVERLQLVGRPTGRDEPDWVAKIHVAVAPVYYHVLGLLISAQLRDHVERHVTHGPFYENEVAGGNLMLSVFGPSARETWRETVLRAPGEDLDPNHFLRSLS